MAVAYDTYAVGKNSSATTSIASFNINVGAGVTNGAVAVFLSLTNQAASAVSVTIGGSAASLIANTDTETDGGDYREMVFGKATGSSTGNLAVVCSWTGNSYGGAIAVSASGVDQTTPFQNGNHAVAGSTPVAVTITSATDNLTVCGACDESGSSGFPTAPTQTSIIAEDNVAFQLGQGASRAAGAASVNHSWTINSGALIAGVDFKAGAGAPTGTGSLASQAASVSGSGILIAYPAYGYATPDAGEIAQSWAAWHLGAGAVVNGNADYGDLIIPPTVTCSSPVIDMGDAGSKQITMSSKYGTNLGTYTRYIRGSDALFAWDDGTPSWTAYTGAVTQAWRYVQVLLTGG